MPEHYLEYTTLPDLISSTAQASHDAQLAAHYAPLICFDNNEPFLPITVGYTVYHTDAPSPSFPRRIVMNPLTHTVIEYAIWFDWDIGHLYELEHIWVYLDKHSKVIRVEASSHGKVRDMATDGRLQCDGERVILYSEPGKHAFAGQSTKFLPYKRLIEMRCGPLAGISGVHITRLYKGIITRKNSANQYRVKNHLAQYAFTPTLQFNRIHDTLNQQLIPWQKLNTWIPQRMDAWLDHLIHREASAEQPAPELITKSRPVEAASVLQIGIV